MPKLGLKYRTEFHMGNMSFLFRTRAWLRAHGCQQEPGGLWRAADTDWYRSHGYVERPIAVWYAVFDGEAAVDYRVPWPIPKGKTLRRADLDDFPIRLDLPGGRRLYGQGPDDGGSPTIFVPTDEAQPDDAPVHVPGRSTVCGLTLSPCLRPGDSFLPLVEGKWIYQHRPGRFAYVTGSGSWVVSRCTFDDEKQIIPQYFVPRLDSLGRTNSHSKICFRNVSKSSDERTLIATTISGSYPCGHSINLFHPRTQIDREVFYTACWMNSFCLDFVTRFLTNGNNTLSLFALLPAPVLENIVFDRFASFYIIRDRLSDRDRAAIDALFSDLFELTPSEYAYLLSTFPLLDRDQPPLPHDYRVRPTNKGLDHRPVSFITRDLALLTYFDYLAGQLEVKPDPARVARICPDGVPEPPVDIVAFFAAAGVDIAGATARAVAETGPYRDLRERVALARELGAVAYVPTIDRRRASFVERAAEAGGLAPEDGVLTPEMARHVLRDKAEREARWQRAMALWEATPQTSNEHRPARLEAVAPTGTR
jgi:hypothetical protein